MTTKLILSWSALCLGNLESKTTFERCYCAPQTVSEAFELLGRAFHPAGGGRSHQAIAFPRLCVHDLQQRLGK